MRSPWTNPIIVRRPTIAALSAAALLVACDQPAGPSRSGGGIVADAQAGTVSAHGSGTVFGSSCVIQANTCTAASAGGKGVKFSFDFSGPNTFTLSVPVSGNWSASDPETGVQLQFTVGEANVVPGFHELSVGGVCIITTPGGPPDGGSMPGECFMDATDESSNGGTDFISFSGQAPNGIISASGQLASGNINID